MFLIKTSIISWSFLIKTYISWCFLIKTDISWNVSDKTDISWNVYDKNRYYELKYPDKNRYYKLKCKYILKALLKSVSWYQCYCEKNWQAYCAHTDIHRCTHTHAQIHICTRYMSWHQPTFENELAK